MVTYDEDFDTTSTRVGEEKYTNFSTVGNEAEKIKMMILYHVKTSTFKKIFGPLTSSESESCRDELTCFEILSTLKALSNMKVVESCMQAMLSLLTTQKTHLMAIDKMITMIIITAFKEQVMTLPVACHLLVSSIDFRMIIPLSNEKINFIRESMFDLDYKNMRDLLKLILIEKVHRIDWSLTEYQHYQLKPIEDLVLDLIDREKNYCPALFFITEISRINARHSSIHFLPRISLKIRELIASFRPLAELGSMLLRSWMYPITAHCGFSWHFESSNGWKLTDSTYKLQLKTHLPYSTESIAPQTYFQYIVLKQPRSQKNLQFIASGTLQRSSSHFQKQQFDDVIEILILEAMQQSEESVLVLANQYNWLHLTHLVVFALCSMCCSFQQLFRFKSQLLHHLNYYPYKKSKEEIMWILLQYISLSKRSTRLQFDSRNRELVNEIFNVLYPDNSTNTSTCSTEDPLNMVRFFAPVAIWINMNSALNQDCAAPPEKFRNLFEFLERQLNSGQPQSNFVAVIANAYSNNSDIFEEHVAKPVLRMLGSNTSHYDVNAVPLKWVLPFERKTELHLNAIDLTFLDSLSFHAKFVLYHRCMSALNSFVNNGSLPTPALIESIVRIILMTNDISLALDFDRQTPNEIMPPGLHFSNMLCKFLQGDSLTRNYDLISILLDMSSYRLVSLTLPMKIHLFQIRSIYEALYSCEYTLGSIEISALLEQRILRHILFAPPETFIIVSFNLMDTQKMATSQNVFAPINFFHNQTKQDSTHTSGVSMNKVQHDCHLSPELNRIHLIALFRALKLVSGSSHPQFTHSSFDFDYIPQLIQSGLRWPKGTAKWFPDKLRDSIFANDLIDRGPDEQYLSELQNYTEQEIRALMEGNTSAFSIPYQQQTFLVTLFRYHSEYSNNIRNNVPMQIFFYELLSRLSYRDLNRNINCFIDYIIWKFLGSFDERQSTYDIHLVRTVNEMIFIHNFVPLERFLFSLITHPNDDDTFIGGLYLLWALLKNFNDISRRVKNITEFAPLHASMICAKSDEFFKSISDHYNTKFKEYSYADMLKLIQGAHPSDTSRSNHLPVYYGSLAERIIPCIDLLFQRSLELDIKQPIFETFLNEFSCLYKLHPQPLTNLYKTIFPLFMKDDASRDSFLRPSPQILKKFVDQVFLYSGQQVCVDDSQAASKFLKILVERIVRASTYVHQPPTFLSTQDWRFTEYPPAGHALTTALIEILASKYTIPQVIDGFLELVIRQPMVRPFDVINTVGMLLTSLPVIFQIEFFAKIEEAFEWPQMIEDDDPSKLFETLNHEVYLHSESRILHVLALLHAYTMHSKQNSLYLLLEQVLHHFGPKVGNESQLMLFLRIIVPYLQRVSPVPIESNIASKYFDLIAYTYEVIGDVAFKVGKLKYEDTVCDLLYQFKYLFVGYFLKSKLEGAIARFPDSMKKKLKFLLTQSSESSFSSTSSASLQTSANVQIPVSKISSHGLHDCSSSYFEPNSSSSEVPMSAQTSTLVNNAPGGTTTASFQTLSEQNVGGNSNRNAMHSGRTLGQGQDVIGHFPTQPSFSSFRAAPFLMRPHPQIVHSAAQSMDFDSLGSAQFENPLFFQHYTGQ